MQIHDQNFIGYTADLLSTPQVQSMANWAHHHSVTTLDHSLSVAYLAYRMASVLGLDARSAARGGLLHDLYLYDKRDRSAHPGLQCFDHPRIAAQNAKSICPLTPKEENIIRSHMWPFGPVLPRSPEAWLVSLADKCSACVELLGLYHPHNLRPRLLALLSPT